MQLSQPSVLNRPFNLQLGAEVSVLSGSLMLEPVIVSAELKTNSLISFIVRAKQQLYNGKQRKSFNNRQFWIEMSQFCSNLKLNRMLFLMGFACIHHSVHKK